MSARFAHNSAFGIVAGLATTFGSFVSTVIITRLLGPEEFGAVAFVVWLVTIITVVADLGIPATLARFLPELFGRGEADEAARLSGYLFRPFAIATLILLGGFTLLAASIFVTQSGRPAAFLSVSPQGEALIWFLVGLSCATKALAGLSVGYLQGLQQFGRVAKLTVAALVVQIVTLVAGSLLFGIPGALAGYMAGSMPLMFAAFSMVRRDVTISSALKKRVVRYSAFTWAAAVGSTFVWSRVELFFLERYWGFEAVGVFTVGLTLASLATQGPQLLTRGLLAHFSERFGQNSIDSMRRTYSVGTRLMAFLSFPICLGMAAIAPTLVPLLFGPGFVDAVPSAVILTSVSALTAVTTVGAQLVFAMERSDFVFLCNVVGMALFIIAGETAIYAFGTTGAAYSRAAIQILMIAAGSWFVSRRLGCPLPLEALGRLLVAAALCALVARITIDLVPGQIALVPAIVLGAMTYIGAVRLMHALPQSDIEQIRALVRNLPRPVEVLTRPLLLLISR